MALKGCIHSLRKGLKERRELLGDRYVIGDYTSGTTVTGTTEP